MSGEAAFFDDPLADPYHDDEHEPLDAFPGGADPIMSLTQHHDSPFHSSPTHDPFDDQEEEEPYNDHEQEAGQESVAEFSPPRAVASSQHQQERTPVTSRRASSGSLLSPGAADYAMSGMTAVDGHGMWTSWTRVFDEPKYACLDLLDNCLDASLQEGFQGKVVMKKFEPNGIVIMNNSQKPIKQLKDVLVVYGSTKGVGRNKKASAIGENGVGLKHGCATLSDANFVLTRNGNTYSLGVIAKSLQTKQGICLPSAWFDIDEPEEKTPEEIEQDFHTHLSNIIAQNPKIGTCVQMDLGQGDMSVGIRRLIKHCQMMWDSNWEEFDHVFQVIITSLIHSHNSGEVASRRAHQGNNPASLFLHDIKQLLPKFYINIPNKGFEFWIQEEKIQFSYWQHRLVELTKFTVYVPKETPIMDIHDINWDRQGYQLSIYCGFEALRLEDDRVGNTAQMYLYSRSSGRLIQHDDDARVTLGLAASGSDYQQGMTVIIDDITAQLPLMPTKQGVAWSEQRGGETHKRNLYAWVAGAADCFWKYHARQFKDRCQTNSFKSMMQTQILRFCDPIRRHLNDLEKSREHLSRNGNRTNSALHRSIAMERLEKGIFTYFRDLDWKRTVTQNTKRPRLRKTFHNPFDVVPGDATVFKFSDEHYPVARATAKAPAPAAAVTWRPPPQPPQRHQQQLPYAQAQQPPPFARGPTPPPFARGPTPPPFARGPIPPHHAHPRGHPPPHHNPRGHPPPPPNHVRHQALVPPQPVPSAVPSAAAAPPMKRRRTEEGGVGTAAELPILLLDEDDDEDEEPHPTRRQVARKSTGPKPVVATRQAIRQSSVEAAAEASAAEAAESQRQVADLQRKLAACQDQLETQKRLMAESQLDHKTAIQRLRQQQLQQKQQQANGNSGVPADVPQALQQTREELTIVKRQRNLLRKELQDVKDQRDEQVSGLNLEIETLKMKLEQHEDTIRRLESASGENADENLEPGSGASDGYSSPGRRSKYHGTDSI